ncbi:AAA family ATPase [Nitrobacteraceae bacterium UC4449_H16]
MSDEKFNSFRAMLLNTVAEPDEDQRRNILAELSELELMTKLANLAEEFQQGDLPDAFDAVTRTMDSFRERTGRRAIQYIDTPIGELLQDEFDDSGVAWRLDCLNQSMRRLRPGDFGIIAGRPDKGKTSFISSEITFFADQLPPDRNIVWLNNEGPGKRIIPRLYQSALNLSMHDMKERHTQGVLVEQYKKAIGGRLDKIRIIDVHGFATGQIESILEESNPGVIVYDMIDNIRGFGDAARTDLMLEEMYKWARERSVKYDCIGLATSQISNDGDGMQFPTLGMLKDSKTGKQGACDFQLMIGASNDVGLAGSRFISLPKNKLRRPDGAADPRAEVVFDGTRARYKDIEVGS